MKRCYRHWALLSLIVLPAVALGANDKVRYRMQVFRVNGNVSCDLSLEKPIWKGSDEDWNRIKDSVQLFDQGTFQLGRDKLEFNRRGCFWNREKISFGSDGRNHLPTKKIEMVYSPNIVRNSKQPVHMKIGSEQPFQYMVKRSDGLFELKTMPLPVGLDITMRTENKKGDYFLVSPLVLTLRTVTEREHIPGMHLQVGRPLLHTSKYSLRLLLDEDKSYGILLRLPDSGGIIIRIELDDK